MQNTDTSGDSFQFDLSKVSLLKMKDYEKHQNRASVKEKIIEEQIRSALEKYMNLCEHLNINCMAKSSVFTVIFLYSRFWSNSDTCKQLMVTYAPNIAEGVNHEELYSAILSNTALTPSNAAWKDILFFLSLVVDLDESIAYENRVLKQLTLCIEEAKLPNCSYTRMQLAMYFMLQMSPSKTPASRMVENFLIEKYTKEDVIIPHDLDVRVMKCIAMFYDSIVDKDEIILALKYTIDQLCIDPTFFNKIKALISLQSENVEIGNKIKSWARPRLSEFVKNLSTSKQDYHVTFENWSSMQKFGINTNMRMQKILYFMRNQVKEIPLQLYCEFFSERVAKCTKESVVDSIDCRPILTCLGYIRTYTHRINSLIDFRTHCLSALTESQRRSFSLAQIVQLYIAVYQHPSIREQCVRFVTNNTWNYNLKKNINVFISENEFEIEPILRHLVPAMID